MVQASGIPLFCGKSRGRRTPQGVGWIRQQWACEVGLQQEEKVSATGQVLASQERKGLWGDLVSPDGRRQGLLFALSLSHGKGRGLLGNRGPSLAGTDGPLGAIPRCSSAHLKSPVGAEPDRAALGSRPRPPSNVPACAAAQPADWRRIKPSYSQKNPLHSPCPETTNLGLRKLIGRTSLDIPSWSLDLPKAPSCAGCGSAANSSIFIKNEHERRPCHHHLLLGGSSSSRN